jgi:hypothetical protein
MLGPVPDAVLPGAIPDNHFKDRIRGCSSSWPGSLHTAPGSAQSNYPPIIFHNIEEPAVAVGHTLLHNP